MERHAARGALQESGRRMQRSSSESGDAAAPPSASEPRLRSPAESVTDLIANCNAAGMMTRLTPVAEALRG